MESMRQCALLLMYRLSMLLYRYRLNPITHTIRGCHAFLPVQLSWHALARSSLLVSMTEVAVCRLCRSLACEGPMPAKLQHAQLARPVADWLQHTPSAALQLMPERNGDDRASFRCERHGRPQSKR